MQKFQFFNLPRPIQERFIESTCGNAAPRPLHYQTPPRNPRVVGSLVSSAVAVVGCGVFACIGFGNLNHRWAINPLWAIGVYAGALCVASVMLVEAVRNWNRATNVPFRRGIYLFPVGVIDARTATLQLHPIQELVEQTTRGTRLRLRFSDGQSFDFRGVEAQRAGKIRGALLDAQQQLNGAAGELSARDQALLDPLFDTGFKNPFSPHESMIPGQVFWKRHWFGLAVVAGAVVGLGVWQLRNQRSAEWMYLRARTLDTATAYRAYLARGGVRADVRDSLLPKAELRQAAGNADAIERYLDAHPQSKIVGYAEQALRDAMLSELDKARATGTVAALREFRKGDPHVSLVKEELAAAYDEPYRAARARFQTQAKDSPELASVFDGLLRYSKQRGPRVEIRFRRRVRPSVQKADDQVKISPYCNDASVPPAQYFDAAHFARREAKAAAALSQRFAEPFAKDILTFELASAVEDDGNPLPVVTQPTLLITHLTELSPPFTSRKPPGVFVGVGLIFKAQILIPEQPPSRVFESSTWSPPNIKRIGAEGWGPAQFYEAMAEEAFAQFVKRYEAYVFR